MCHTIARFLFLCLIAALPLFRPFSFTIGGTLVPLPDLIFPFCVFFLLLAFARSEAKPVFTRFHLFLGGFALGVVISAVFADASERSIVKLAGTFYLLALAALTIQFVSDRDFLRPVLFAWLAGILLTILATIAGLMLFLFGYSDQTSNYFIFHFGSLPAGNYPRLMALFANPNLLCTYLAASLPLVFAARSMNWISAKKTAFFIVGISLATVFSFSPGIGGVVLAGCLWFCFYPRIAKGRKLVIAVVSVLAAASFLFAASFAFDSVNSDSDIAVWGTGVVIEPSARALAWKSSLDTFLAQPVTGKGIGSQPAFVKYETLSGKRLLLTDAHNMWLSVASQTGSIGLAAFMMLLVYVFRACRCPGDKSTPWTSVHIAVSCSFIGGALYQGLTGSFEDARHLWVLYGLIVALDGQDNAELNAD